MLEEQDYKFDDDDNAPDPLDDDYDPFEGTETTGTVVSNPKQYVLNKDGYIPETPGATVEPVSQEQARQIVDPSPIVEVVTEDGEIVQEDTPIPASLPVIYEGLSARFVAGTSPQAKTAAIKVWVQAHEVTPMFLGGLFNQLNKEDGVKYEDIASQVGLKAGTVKNYASWDNRVPPENRIPGMTVTIWQEAASIKDLNEQREFIETAVNGDYNKKQLRAIKEGEEPEDYTDEDQEVHKETCPTCGTKVRAELLQ